MRLFLACLWVLAASAADARAALKPSIPEVRVTPEAPGHVLEAGSIHALPDGRALVVWTSEQPDVWVRTAFGRIVGSDGRPQSLAFQLNDVTGTAPGSLGSVAAAVAADGSFLAAWQARDPDDEDAWRIYVRAFDAAAAPQGPEIAVNEDDVLDALAGVVSLASGQYAILWSTETGAGSTVQLRRLAIDGTPLAPAVIVDAAAAGTEQTAALALAAAGDAAIVAWRHGIRVGGTGDYDDVNYIGSYDGSGNPVAAAFAFEDPPVGGRVYRMSLVLDGGGDLAAAWFVSDSYTGLWRARRLALDGTVLGELERPSEQHFALKATPGGELVAAWNDLPEDFIYQSFTQGYAGDGTLADAPVAIVDDLYLTASYQGELAHFDLNGSGSVWALIAERRSDPDVQDVSGYFVRRICDGSDATCRLCPDFDDAIDSDGDGVADGCDPCTNVGGAQDASRRAVMVSFGGEEPDPAIIAVRDNRVSLRHRVVLPPSTSFAALPVEEKGVRLRIESVRGGAMVDVTLPGGTFTGADTAGWLRRGSKVIYQDRTATPINGLRRVVLKDLTVVQPNLVAVQMKAAAGTYAVDGNLLPLSAVVTLGGHEEADAGMCSESSFDPEDCVAFGTLVRSTVQCAAR